MAELDWDYRAPNIAIAGVDVIRAMVLPTELDDDGEMDTRSIKSWTLQGVPVAGVLVSEFGVIGDPFLRDQGWDLSVTAVARLAFRDEESLKDMPVDHYSDVLEDELGKWTSFALWDSVANSGRSLCALTKCPIVIPENQPRIRFVGGLYQGG